MIYCTCCLYMYNVVHTMRKCTCLRHMDFPLIMVYVHLLRFSSSLQILTKYAETRTLIKYWFVLRVSILVLCYMYMYMLIEILHTHQQQILDNHSVFAATIGYTFPELVHRWQRYMVKNETNRIIIAIALLLLLYCYCFKNQQDTHGFFNCCTPTTFVL